MHAGFMVKGRSHCSVQVSMLLMRDPLSLPAQPHYCELIGWLQHHWLAGFDWICQSDAKTHTASTTLDHCLTEGHLNCLLHVNYVQNGRETSNMQGLGFTNTRSEISILSQSTTETNTIISFTTNARVWHIYDHVCDLETVSGERMQEWVNCHINLTDMQSNNNLG